MQKDENRNLRNSLPYIIRAMTGQRGIKYVPIGPPRTTKNTIYTYPLPLQLDPKGVVIVLGDTWHECSHALFTDFDVIESESKKPGHSKLRHSIWNSVEDTMGEHLMGREFYGCRNPLAKSVEYAIERGMCRTGEKSPSDALTTFVDLWGRKFINKQNVDPIFAIAEKELTKFLGEKGKSKLVDLLSKKLNMITSTWQSYLLADEILKTVQDIADIQQQPEQDQDDSQGDDSSPGDDSGKGDDSQGDDSSPGDDSGKGDGAGYGENAESILDDPNISDDPIIDIKGLLKEALGNAENSFVFDPCMVKIEQQPLANAFRYNSWRDGIHGEVMKLQRKLANEFITSKKSKTIRTDEGRLDNRNLFQAYFGRTNVYKKEIKSLLPAPAVTVLDDTSGSMDGREHVLGMQACIAMSEVMALLNVPFEMWTFQGKQITNYKYFEEPFSLSVKERIGAASAGGGTPTAQGLWVTASRLIERREPRKILIVITDGGPDNPGHAKEVGELIENSNIELYGIGIGVEPKVMANFCSKYATIQSADDIAEALLLALSQRMLM